MANKFDWKDYVNPAIVEGLIKCEGYRVDIEDTENLMTPSQKKEAFESMRYSVQMSEAHSGVVKRYRELEKRNAELLELYRNEPNKRKAEQLLKEYNKNKATMSDLKDAADYFASEHKKVSKTALAYDDMITQALVKLGKMQAPNK